MRFQGGFGHNFDFDCDFQSSSIFDQLNRLNVCSDKKCLLQAACVQEVDFECKPLEIETIPFPTVILRSPHVSSSRRAGGWLCLVSFSSRNR